MSQRCQKETSCTRLRERCVSVAHGADSGQAKKGRLAPRATQSLRSTLTLQYVGTPVINLLADVPGSMRDLEPPAKMYSKAVSELRAVLEVP